MQSTIDFLLRHPLLDLGVLTFAVGAVMHAGASIAARGWLEAHAPKAVEGSEPLPIPLPLQILFPMLPSSFGDDALRRYALLCKARGLDSPLVRRRRLGLALLLAGSLGVVAGPWLGL
jgi:hypothetical protein